MKECSKSIARRQSDPNFLNRYFSGDGIDIGGAPDPLSLYRELFPRMGSVRIWDLADGDAELMEGVGDATFDFVHSSHCLEHLNDPARGLENWFRILKPGGYLIVTVPDEDLYEQGVFPSSFNSDHKWTFTIFKQESWSAHSRNLLAMLSALGPAADIQKLQLLSASFRYELPRFDQTLTPIAEAGIEFVIRKRPDAEVEFGGRRPPGGAVSQEQFTQLTGIKLARPVAQAPSGEQVAAAKDMLQVAMDAHRAGVLDVAETKYRKVLDVSPNDADALHLLGTVLHQRGDNRGAQPLIEKAIAANPDAAAYQNSYGLVLRALNQSAEACQAWAKALKLSPGYLDAHNNLGMTLAEMKQFDNAETVLRVGLEEKPDSTMLRTSLGRTLLLKDDVDRAVAEFQNVLDTEPSHVNALNNLGVALNLIDDRVGARSAFERALAADPNHVDAHYNYSHLLLTEGDFENGWDHFEWRLRRRDYGRKFDVPQWDGEPLNGRTVLLWSEQGLGDAVQFIRYAPMVAAQGGTVIVECRKPVIRLFQQVAGISGVFENREAKGYDLHVPMMSLPAVFKSDLNSIPAPVPYVEGLEPIPVPAADGALKIGLAWAGNPGYSRDKHRTRALAEFAPLAKLPNVEFFGLQTGPAGKQEPPPGMIFTDLVEDVLDFHDTARVMLDLDLVISVDTAMAHLAGALGLPVWILLYKASDWRWLLERDDSPWYPTMRLFRCKDDWPSLFEDVASALRQFRPK